MAFIELLWRKISAPEVVAAFLRAERSKLNTSQHSAIDQDDFHDIDANQRRFDLIWGIRGALLAEIPETTWHLVSTMTTAELPELRVIGRCGWDHPDDHNELDKVCRRKPLPLRAPPSEWAPVILWGHDQRGPFTILEGNHRFVAYSGCEQRPPLALSVIVGLSPSPCFWHLPDRLG